MKKVLVALVLIVLVASVLMSQTVVTGASSARMTAIAYTGGTNSGQTGLFFTPTQPIVIEQFEVNSWASVSGCSTSAVVRLRNGGGFTDTNLTLSNGTNRWKATGLNLVAAAGTAIEMITPTNSASCGSAPSNVYGIIVYRMR